MKTLIKNKILENKKWTAYVRQILIITNQLNVKKDRFFLSSNEPRNAFTHLKKRMTNLFLLMTAYYYTTMWIVIHDIGRRIKNMKRDKKRKEKLSYSYGRRKKITDKQNIIGISNMMIVELLQPSLYVIINSTSQAK